MCSPNVLHVLKRWAAWPRSIRWLAVIAAVMLGLAIAWVLFVPIADWLAHHDVGSAAGPLHETALDNARGRLLTLGAGLFAAGALIFTARNFTLSRRTFELTELGQVTDRYTKAIEQLGSDKLDARIGGIYALERIARDSARDHPTVMEVLSAVIRDHSHDPWPPPDPNRADQERTARPDVQAALTVIGRRDEKRDIRPIDLRRADLTRVHVTDARLHGAVLTDADLSGAFLGSADLSDATLINATCIGAGLVDADLSGAHLRFADLTGAQLHGAYLTRTDLAGANLHGAWLPGAHLHGAILGGANLTGAHFEDSDLTSANLQHADLQDVADLTNADFHDADLTSATWPRHEPVPEGWELDDGTGRLRRAGTDSGPAEAN